MSDKYKAAYDTWQEKTEWVQETAVTRELGKHRADVLRERIENLKLELANLKMQKPVAWTTENGLSHNKYRWEPGYVIPLYNAAGAQAYSHPCEGLIIKTGREMSHNLTGNGFLFLDEAHLDITGADNVEILIRGDSKVIWVNVQGVCVLRICQIKNLVLTDER